MIPIYIMKNLLLSFISRIDIHIDFDSTLYYNSVHFNQGDTSVHFIPVINYKKSQIK